MATFVMPKSVDDVQEGELLPEDWYVCRISKEPTLEKNKALVALEKGEIQPGDPKAEKVGHNIVIQVRTVSDIPEHNGRMFTIWLPTPSDGDDNRYDGRGQTYLDSKLARIGEFASAFAGGASVEGSDVDFYEGQMAQLYVIQQLDQSGIKMTNSVNSFAGARPVEDATSDDGTPF
jgi:hypothetical protein